MGHMRRLTEVELPVDPLCIHYIPHHTIWYRKDDGQKLRVVFNASCTKSSPKMQSDLTVVLTRWRRWGIAYCVDIQMMFRQISVNLEDAHLQRIVCSPLADEPETHYILCTVTYEESYAPYLALQMLKQLCLDNGGSLPEADKAIK